MLEKKEFLISKWKENGRDFCGHSESWFGNFPRLSRLMANVLYII